MWGISVLCLALTVWANHTIKYQVVPLPCKALKKSPSQTPSPLNSGMGGGGGGDLFFKPTFLARGSATDGHYNLTSPWIHVGPCDMWVTNWDLWMSNLHIVCTGYPESYMFIIACLIPRLTSVIFAHEHMYCTRCLYQFPERFANDVPNCIVTYMYMLAYH